MKDKELHPEVFLMLIVGIVGLVGVWSMTHASFFSGNDLAGQAYSHLLGEGEPTDSGLTFSDIPASVGTFDNKGFTISKTEYEQRMKTTQERASRDHYILRCLEEHKSVRNGFSKSKMEAFCGCMYDNDENSEVCTPHLN